MNKVAQQINKMCLAAMFLAFSWLMPFLTGQIQSFGQMLLPMHLPIFIAGFVLGPYYGALVGFIAPLTRSLIFGMPPMIPTAVAMAFELATYAFISGLLFKVFVKLFGKIDSILAIYVSLIVAMILGRLVGGLFSFTLTISFTENEYTFYTFLTGYFVEGWPGIILQLVVVPALIRLLYGLNLLKNTNTIEIK